MAGRRQRKNGSWEFIFKRKGVLPDPVYVTFNSEEEGDRYAQRAEAMLDEGVIPLELRPGAMTTLSGLCTLYGATAPMSPSEAELLPTITKSVEGARIDVFDYTWCETWVDSFKATGRSPSTISKRVSGLARVVDWAMRKNMVSFTVNPLRMMPRGYGSSGLNRNKLWSGERDRRLEPTEEGAIRKVLLSKEEHLLFDMALETAMRLGEMFTLKCADVDLARRTIFLHATKNGTRRQVPISSVLLAKLQAWDLTQDYLFSAWWSGGDAKEKYRVGHMLSHKFAKRFEQAGCADVRFHDLRHTAVCHLYERTRMSDMEISKITGHKGFRMLQRYANLRGSDLASKMW